MLSGVTTCDQITYADRTVQGYSEEPYATGFVGVLPDSGARSSLIGARDQTVTHGVFHNFRSIAHIQLSINPRAVGLNRLNT